MQKYDQNQYVEIFYKLPPEIKDVVASTQTTEHLWKIGQKRNLHIDKIGIMTDISFDVMMGIIASKNFEKELETELGISAIDASVLARDIDENVFKPIKSQMISIYGSGAPYKPSSSLVQITEDEDDHANLDKDLLLREIESPVIAKPKVVPNSPFEGSTAKPGGMSKTTVIEEYHEEIGKGNVAPKPSEPILPKVELTAPKVETEAPKMPSNAFDHLASMKLSQAFVMPKPSGFVNMKTIEQKDAANAAAAAPKPKAPEAPAPKQYTADPYREALK